MTFVLLQIVHFTMFMEDSDTWTLDRIDGKGHVFIVTEENSLLILPIVLHTSDLAECMYHQEQ